MLQQGRLARARPTQNSKPKWLVRLAIEQVPQAKVSTGDRLLSLWNDARTGLTLCPRHEPEVDKHLFEKEPRRYAIDGTLASKQPTFALYETEIDAPARREETQQNAVDLIEEPV